MSACESSHASTPMHTPRQAILVWAAVVTAPAASLGDLQAGYTLTLFACSRGLHFLPLVSTAIALVWVASAILYASRFDSAEEKPPRQPFAGYARMYEAAAGQATAGPMGWVAFLAVGLNAAALLVIVGMAIPRLMLDPCWR